MEKKPEEKLFKLHSKYKPTGDQPQAIEKLVDGKKSSMCKICTYCKRREEI